MERKCCCNHDEASVVCICWLDGFRTCEVEKGFNQISANKELIAEIEEFLNQEWKRDKSEVTNQWAHGYLMALKAVQDKLALIKEKGK